MHILTFQSDDAENEILNAPNYQNVRLFRASKNPSRTPLDDLGGIDVQWSRPTLSKFISTYSTCLI